MSFLLSFCPSPWSFWCFRELFWSSSLFSGREPANGGHDGCRDSLDIFEPLYIARDFAFEVSFEAERFDHLAYLVFLGHGNVFCFFS